MTSTRTPFIKRALAQAARIRECENRPEGHRDVDTPIARLGDSLYRNVKCEDCGRERPYGSPLVICDGCNVLPPWEHRCHTWHLMDDDPHESATVKGEPSGRPCDCSQCQPIAAATGEDV